jgi:hypothetical protein
MLKFTPLETQIVRRLQADGADAYENTPERATSDRYGNPRRRCLRKISAGEPMLILAHRPFPGPQPYAETGPVFLCAKACSQHCGLAVPQLRANSPDYLERGYGADHRIRYGTGTVIARQPLYI